MAKFLTTSATSYHLEERNKIKELLEDKNRLKIDIRIIYGKVELTNEESNWLKELDYIRTSFCENLHAKCYMNENICIVTSMNLYDFSQINNNEMGILIKKDEDLQLYKDTKEEVERIIRISEEVRMSIVKVEKMEANEDKKLSTSKLAKKLKLKTDELHKKLIEQKYLIIKDNKEYLSVKGKEAGGELKKFRGKNYFVWNEDIKLK